MTNMRQYMGILNESFNILENQDERETNRIIINAMPIDNALKELEKTANINRVRNQKYYLDIFDRNFDLKTMSYISRVAGPKSNRPNRLVWVITYSGFTKKCNFFEAGLPVTIRWTSGNEGGRWQTKINDGPWEPSMNYFVQNNVNETVELNEGIIGMELSSLLYQIFEYGRNYGTTNKSKYFEKTSELIDQLVDVYGNTVSKDLTQSNIHEAATRYNLYKVYDSDRMTLVKVGNSIEELKAEIPEVLDWKPNKVGGFYSKSTGYVIRPQM